MARTIEVDTNGYGEDNPLLTLKKHFFKRMNSHIEKQGFTILSQIYFNCNFPLKLKCPRGHISYKNLANIAHKHNIDRNIYCPECASEKLFKFDMKVKSIIEKKKGKFLGTEKGRYGHRLYKYQCEAGHENGCPSYELLYRNVWCRKCYFRKVTSCTIQEVKLRAKEAKLSLIFSPEFEYSDNDEEKVPKKTALWFICNNKHIFSRQRQNFTSSRTKPPRCMKCSYKKN